MALAIAPFLEMRHAEQSERFGTLLVRIAYLGQP